MSNAEKRLKIKDFKTKIDILVQAKVAIKSSVHNFVCLAIMGASQKMFTGARHETELRGYIMRQIRPYVNLDQWLRYSRPTFKRDRNSMQEYRVQWIDWMIQQYEDQIKELDGT